MQKYQSVIGLEIHVQLKTKSKMFCGCKNDPEEASPNINTCPICLAHPGTLPVINKKAVALVLKTAKALNCQIAEIPPQIGKVAANIPFPNIFPDSFWNK